jgi:hypothetical protein
MTKASVYKHRDYLSVLSRCSPQTRNRILENASPELIKCICECAINGVHGNVCHSLPVHKRKRVRRAGVSIVRAIRGSKTLKGKRNRLKKLGGFLPLILAPALGAILGALGTKVVNKLITS